MDQLTEFGAQAIRLEELGTALHCRGRRDHCGMLQPMVL